MDFLFGIIIIYFVLFEFKGVMYFVYYNVDFFGGGSYCRLVVIDRVYFNLDGIIKNIVRIIRL